jgi:hypothetical protein
LPALLRLTARFSTLCYSSAGIQSTVLLTRYCRSGVGSVVGMLFVIGIFFDSIASV